MAERGLGLVQSLSDAMDQQAAAGHLPPLFKEAWTFSACISLAETTVSIGVAGGPANTELEVLLAAADTALYQAKRGGRNRVASASEEPVSLVKERKGGVYAPKSVDIADEIPISPLGKPDKKTLRAQYWGETDRQVN